MAALYHHVFYAIGNGHWSGMRRVHRYGCARMDPEVGRPICGNRLDPTEGAANAHASRWSANRDRCVHEWLVCMYPVHRGRTTRSPSQGIMPTSGLTYIISRIGQKSSAPGEPVASGELQPQPYRRRLHPRHRSHGGPRFTLTRSPASVSRCRFSPSTVALAVIRVIPRSSVANPVVAVAFAGNRLLATDYCRCRCTLSPCHCHIVTRPPYGHPRPIYIWGRIVFFRRNRSGLPLAPGLARGQVGVSDVSENRLSSSREPKRKPGTAASKNHTCVRLFAQVPAAVGRDHDRSVRSTLSGGKGLFRMHRDLDLQQRHGMSVGAIRRYARQRCAAGSLPADGSEVRTLTKRSPAAMPTTQRFQDTFLQALSRMNAPTSAKNPSQPATQETMRTLKGETIADPAGPRQAPTSQATAR